jgi:hypothetical protein
MKIGQHQPRVVGSHVDRNLSCPQLQPGQVHVDHRLVQQPKVELILHDAQRRRLHILRTQRPDVDPHLRLHLRWYSLGAQCIPGLIQIRDSLLKACSVFARGSLGHVADRFGQRRELTGGRTLAAVGGRRQ